MQLVMTQDPIGHVVGQEYIIEVNKGVYVVARNFFRLLLNCSAWPCLGWVLLSKTYKPLFTPLYMLVCHHHFE